MNGFTKFQFQNGTIKRWVWHRQYCQDSEFQFQNGTIKSNKSLVVPNSAAVFQFQNGTIKSSRKRRSNPLFLSISIPKWYD